MKARLLWMVWGVSAVALSYWLMERLNTPSEQGIFLPGQTTAGHYQIELACSACHTETFTTAEDFQPACEGCHEAELDEARDTHPQSKFTDPRNADRVALLDARNCVACHREHRPEITRAMGVTLPDDFCGLCHQDIAEVRPSHTGMGFETCASAGCHNFHDNRSIYEDFLLRHAEAPALSERRALPARNFASIAAYIEGYPKETFPLDELTAALADAPADLEADGVHGEIMDDWLASAHARNGVNCSACHSSADTDWVERPAMAVCETCHTNEVDGFRSGRHGMRLDTEALGMSLAPLEVANARAPLSREPLADSLTCNTCHGAHDYDTEFAAVDACQGCHADEHTLAYAASPHARLGRNAAGGLAADAETTAEPSVTCATCHMPRTEVSYQFGAFVHVLVDHNQNANLRPNEKMIRSVCLDCHGLGFSIDALADPDLIRRNFAGEPAVHVESIELAVERRRQIDAERARERAAREN